MIDLHTHSLLSDGELLPSELARRYEEKGFLAIAITDHADMSNVDDVACAIVRFCRAWPKDRIKVIPGIELTHLPPEQFKKAVSLARERGVRVVVGHGETLVEPVVKGTNRAALEAGVDVLAHPGLISDPDVRLAVRNSVFLELSARKGHCLANGHVARLAVKFGAKMCINSDAHAPSDIPSRDSLEKVALGAGLSGKQARNIPLSLKNFI